MSINSLDQYLAAAKQRIQLAKTGALTTVAAAWFSPFAIAGAPGAGTLAGVSADPGVFADDSIAGYPKINAFGGGAEGYLSKVEFASSVACRIALFDRLWVSGAHSFNANTAIATPTDISSRVPNTDYKGLEIWIETVTAFTLNQTWNATYTDDAGNMGHTTGATGIGAAPTVGRCFQLPLAAGDSGVQQVTNIAGAVGSAGTANIMILRPLWSGRVRMANDGDVHDLLRTGFVKVYDTTALYMLVAADSTAMGVPELSVAIANA